MAANGQLTVAAILVAAGAGAALGAGMPKALCLLGGRTLTERAVARFAAHPAVRDVVVVAPPTHLAEVAELVARVQSQARLSSPAVRSAPDSVCRRSGCHRTGCRRGARA